MAESDLSSGTTPAAPPPETTPESVNEACSAFVRMLYPELVAEIFSLCVSGSWLPYCRNHKLQVAAPGDAARRWVGPLPLVSVCRSWKRVAMAHPPLWTALLLTAEECGEDPRTELKEQLDYLEQQISRTGTALPLSIRLQQIETDAEERKVWDGMYRTISSFLTKYADRWKEIDCRLDGDFFPLFMSKTHIYPSLTTLSIKSAGDFPRRFLDLDVSTPSLTHIFLARFYLRRIGLPQPPFRLVKLDLKQFYADECLAAIKYCASTLVHLCLRSIVDGDDNHPMPSEPIVATRVQTCDISVSRGWGSDNLPVILGHLVCPNIRRFRYMETSGLASSGGLAAVQFFTTCLEPSNHQETASQDPGLQVGNHYASNTSLSDCRTHNHHRRHRGVLAIIHDVHLAEGDLFRLWSARSDVTVFGFLREPVDASRPFLDVEVDILEPGKNGRVPSFDIDAKSVKSVGSYWKNYLASATYLLPAL